MKDPTHRAALQIIGTNITRRGAYALADFRAQDQQVAKNDARRGRRHVCARRPMSQSFAQVDAAVATETRNRCARVCIECPEVLSRSGHDATARRAGPIHDSSVMSLRSAAVGDRIESPKLLPRGRVESEDVRSRGRCKENAPDDDRIALNLTQCTFGSAGIVGPGHLQLFDVRPIDLRQRRIVRATGVAQIVLPLPITGCALIRPGSLIRAHAAESKQCGDQEPGDPKTNDLKHASPIELRKRKCRS